jgi:O-antigen ligase
MFLLPPLLALVPRGAAPLVALAGLFAAALAAAQPARTRLAALWPPAAILAALLAWGGASAVWSITPGRSLLLDARLAGLFAAGLALAAAGRIAATRRLATGLLAGTILGIALALVDLASRGGVSRYVSMRPFIGPRLNQESVWAALMLLPITARLVAGGRRALAAGVALLLTATILALDDTTAKLALAASLPVAGFCYLRRAAMTRLAAALSVLAIVTAPLTLPQLARLPHVFAAVDAFKSSAGHRLLIWSFAGDRIAERPFLGWGLDTARAIPGGKDEIRPGQDWLPLHTHDGAIQVWLELGAAGAALLALLVFRLWSRLGAANWPRGYAAAAAGSLTVALVAAGSGWGLWEEWWIATLEFALFAILALAPPSAATQPRRRDWRGAGRSDREDAS